MFRTYSGRPCSVSRHGLSGLAGCHFRATTFKLMRTSADWTSTPALPTYHKNALDTHVLQLNMQLEHTMLQYRSSFRHGYCCPTAHHWQSSSTLSWPSWQSTSLEDSCTGSPGWDLSELLPASTAALASPSAPDQACKCIINSRHAFASTVEMLTPQVQPAMICRHETIGVLSYMSSAGHDGCWLNHDTLSWMLSSIPCFLKRNSSGPWTAWCPPVY